VRVIYRLLGNLEIGPNGQTIDLPGGHSLLVLAALLINANQRMSKNDLLKAGWGSNEVSEAQLHKSAAALRAALAQIDHDDDLITHTRHGYELRVPDVELDMLRFRNLITQAEQARSQRRLEDEILLLREGLRLWRGRVPLCNVPGDAFRQEVGRLEQRRKHAAVRLFDLEIARRRYDRILDDLATMHAYHPTDGRLGQQLMIAQYRCGHVTDATVVFERYASAIADQTGGPPDPELRALHYAIARNDESAVTAAELAIASRTGMTDPVTPAMVAVPRQLPPDAGDFVGRDDLVTEACWVLGRASDRAVPVVVIWGPSGIGKTTLASRVAHRMDDRYPDGQLYAELRTASGRPTDTNEVLAQFLRAFGVATVPAGRAERVATYRTLLSSRQVLVVLDDAADESQIRDLIPANPSCGVLATARRRLPEIAGVHHLPPLSPLTSTIARELFLRVCDNSRIDVRAELDAVDQVVALCGGLPLALRIAGAMRVHDHPRPAAGDGGILSMATSEVRGLC
jgi:DNA-binding SARP family transcriptional activator